MKDAFARRLAVASLAVAAVSAGFTFLSYQEQGRANRAQESAQASSQAYGAAVDLRDAVGQALTSLRRYFENDGRWQSAWGHLRDGNRFLAEGDAAGALPEYRTAQALAAALCTEVLLKPAASGDAALAAACALMRPPVD